MNAAVAEKRGPDSYWRNPTFAKRYCLNNVETVRANDGAKEFSALCMAAIGQGIQYLCPQPSAIVDLGCGPATRSSTMRAFFGCRVVGVDYSEPMIAEARNIMEFVRPEMRVELTHADVAKLPFADGEFDVAMCYGLLMSLEELQPALAEIGRVAKYGLVAIEETPTAMDDIQYRAFLDVKERVFPGRIVWHSYLSEFTKDGYGQVTYTPLPVPPSWSLGTPPGYARLIASKVAL